MESVALSNEQLDYLARDDPLLKAYFRGVFPCDGLPSKPRGQQSAYIINTDKKGQPGKHWIALWTRDNLCEVMDSYALPIEVYGAKPLEEWLKKWKYVVSNGQSLQNENSKSCGHYALMFLKAKARDYAHYIVAFKNPRDGLGIRNLLLQSFPTHWKDVLHIFHRATSRPFGYMLLDLHPASSDDVRLYSYILKDEGWTRCYQNKRDGDE